MTFSLTMSERLNLDGFLSAQRGTRDTMNTFQDVRDKLQVTPELTARYVIQLSDGRSLVGPEEIETAPEFEISLEKQEQKAIFDTIQAWPNFQQWEPKVWVNSLAKKLV